MWEPHSPFYTLSWHPGQTGEKAIVIRRRTDSLGFASRRSNDKSHTQPYSYHTVCGSPPGSGDAGVLFELFP